MIAILLDNGDLMIPKAAYSGKNKISGDGMIRINKDDKDYSRWIKFAVPEDEYKKHRTSP